LTSSSSGLVKKISKALKETGGASSEYQQVVIELKGLKNALRHLEALEPSEDNVNHVNAIRGMALACQLPLREFLANFERYESSMGPFAATRSFRGAGRKAKWALAVTGEVEKLRALIGKSNQYQSSACYAFFVNLGDKLHGLNGRSLTRLAGKRCLKWKREGRENIMS